MSQHEPLSHVSVSFSSQLQSDGHVRIRDSVPSPHDAEHIDHPDQTEHNSSQSSSHSGTSQFTESVVWQLGSLFVHIRNLAFVAVPHVAEQGDHGDHNEQLF